MAAPQWHCSQAATGRRMGRFIAIRFSARRQDAQVQLFSPSKAQSGLDLGDALRGNGQDSTGRSVIFSPVRPLKARL